MYTVMSNLTEVATAETSSEAINLAVAESWRFDDVVTVNGPTGPEYMAQHGALYRLVHIAAIKSVTRK